MGHGQQERLSKAPDGLVIFDERSGAAGFDVVPTVSQTSIVQDVQRAAGYIDRTLRGPAVGDLPVQAAERFLTAINLKTAGALGLTITPSLMAKADELIE